MKKNHFFAYAALTLLALMALSLAACKNDPDDPPPPSPQSSVYKWTGGGNSYELTITEKLAKAIVNGDYTLKITDSGGSVKISNGTAQGGSGDTIVFTPVDGSAAFTLKIETSGSSITVTIPDGATITIDGHTLQGGTGTVESGGQGQTSGTDTALNGTWADNNITGPWFFTFNNGILEKGKDANNPTEKGTYTANASTLTMTITHILGSVGTNLTPNTLDPTKWYTKDEWAVAVPWFSPESLNAWFYTTTWPYQIKGNDLVVTDEDGIWYTVMMTKDGSSSSAAPFIGTWKTDDDIIFTFSSGAFTTQYPGDGYWMKGAWARNTENPNKLIFVITHMANDPGVATADDLPVDADMWEFTFQFLSDTSLKLHDIANDDDLSFTKVP